MSREAIDSHSRTLEDFRRMLEELAGTCETEMRRARNARESDLLRNVVGKIHETRAGVLDVSIAMAQYLTYCLQQDDQEKGCP